MANIKRQTAFKCRIAELLNGRYVKREGWEPNYLETSKGKVSRVNVLAVVIESNNSSLILDDGTGTIEVRSFDEDKTIMQRRIGEMVFVIGRPRVFNEKKFIVPEIIKKVENKKWAEYRKVELGKIILSNNTTEIVDSTSNVSSGPDITDSILQKITELDKGYGVKTDEVIKSFNKKTANLTIIKLLENGELFEIKPGILKSI